MSTANYTTTVEEDSYGNESYNYTIKEDKYGAYDKTQIILDITIFF